jgi:hypothetical protein
MKTILLAGVTLAAVVVSLPADAASARHHIREFHGAYGYAGAYGHGSPYGRPYRAQDPDLFIRGQILRDVPLKDTPSS